MLTYCTEMFHNTYCYTVLCNSH